MQPVVMIDLRLVYTSLAWQPAVPQLRCAMRKSPGLTNRTNHGSSWFKSVYDRWGLADDGQAPGMCGRTCDSSLVNFVASPPWQSVQPMCSVSLKCGSWV